MTAEAGVIDVKNVVWCTGFVSDFSWIDLSVFDQNGEPKHERGVVPSEPGLYFIGLFFLYAGTSSLIGGVGRDARHIARHLTAQDRSDVASLGELDAAFFHRVLVRGHRLGGL